MNIKKELQIKEYIDELEELTGERVNDANELYNLIQKQLELFKQKKLSTKKMKKIYEVYARILNQTDKATMNTYFNNEEIKKALFKWSRVK
ncbi:MAG: hypothetical protein ACFFFT_11210 [Candidatus Thorarchaeota archaeon]